MCDRVLGADGEEPLTDARRKALLDVNASLAAQGLRVLALARGPVAEPSEAALRNLAFAGYVGLLDPPAPGVEDAIGRLRDAGLRTIMLTGDQRFTAEAIGQRLGVLSPDDEALDSRELRTLSAEELGERLERIAAFSRISPEDKLTIVGALRARGEIVAMLGDGVNDAPALLTADLAIAIGAGTDVAVEAGDVVLVRSDPRDVPRIIALSLASYRKMVQNLWWAAGYNIAAIPLAAGALAAQGLLLPPAIAAVLMSASTVIVAVNAQLLRRARV
jgi:Cu2+-exporting ATPase